MEEGGRRANGDSPKRTGSINQLAGKRGSHQPTPRDFSPEEAREPASDLSREGGHQKKGDTAGDLYHGLRPGHAL